MNRQELSKFNLPDKPGVYKFLQGKQLLYIGKATSLKDRVRSYFNGDIGDQRGPKIEQMLVLANKVEWQETDSVLEALLLETELIKKNQPKYNSREKDDKSYWYVIITDGDFPRVLPTRGRELDCAKSNLAQSSKLGIKYQFGPFPYGAEIKEALKIIRKIFPYRDKCVPCTSRGTDRGATSSESEVVPCVVCKPCFNRQIGLCPGVCTGEISKLEYKKIIQNIKLLFGGKKKEIIKNLEREMKILAKKQEFEKAGQVRNQIFALQHIRDVSLLKSKGVRGETSGRPLEDSPRTQIRIEAYDIAHLSGKATVGAMVVWQNGELQKGEYKKFKLKGNKSEQANDPANLREILERRFNHPEWPLPDIIVVDGNEVQRKVAEGVTRNAVGNATSSEPEVVFRTAPTIIAVTKDDRHKALKLIGDSAIIKDYHRAIVEVNAEAHRFAISYHRLLMRKRL